jgi:hypothetical protein
MGGIGGTFNIEPTEESNKLDISSSSSSSIRNNNSNNNDNDNNPKDKDDIPDPDDPNNNLSSMLYSKVNQQTSKDLSGVAARLLSIGQDLVVRDYVGNMGFEEVTDWEYFYENEEDPTDRKVVQPNPFDTSKPKRTRVSSGSVVRIFRAEWAGRLGGTLRSKGMDSRILIKEYSGRLALELARNEQASIGRLQSLLVSKIDGAVDGDWIQSAASRSVLSRRDDANVADLLGLLTKAPFLGILGEVDLAELDGEMDPNDFYRALGVPPPKPEAIWVVYEYVGLNTVASYTNMPPEARRAQLPPKKTFFGSLAEPSPLPPFRERARYVAQGIMKGAVEAVATMHEAGIGHRSIGRSSLIITSPTQDKAEASSVYFTRLSGLVVKLGDFGFSGLLEDSTNDKEFINRARAFGLRFRSGEKSLAATNFAMAEDLHALGFVFLGLLLTSLAELPNGPNTPMPDTDEDTLQRLLGEIFAKDFAAFREYVEAEEDVWGSMVALLDEMDGAGWTVLEALFMARETTARTKNSMQVVTARGLLSNPFFQQQWR